MRSPVLGYIPGLAEKFGKKFALNLFKRANFSRCFEYKVKEAADAKILQIPIYLCIGTEFNSAALSLVSKDIDIFGQHRGHGVYLSYGARPESLRDELLGLPSGCSGGMSGSNAIQAREINMYGHSGLMGEQVPIAVGSCFASKRPTLTICGDASVEEDYIYPSLGWAVKEQLPILFVCEDNDLSILTKVDVRRNWSPVDVAKSMGMFAIDIADDPWVLAHYAHKIFESGRPGFINIRCVRHLWHAGTGCDGIPEWDRYALVYSKLKELGLEKELLEIENKNKQKAMELWEKQLPIQ